MGGEILNHGMLRLCALDDFCEALWFKKLVSPCYKHLS